MGFFSNYFNNYDLRNYFESCYEDVSEPLKEYIVNNDGSLTETCTSDSLLGVCVNGKWGWVDMNNMFVIQPIYDSGFITCYNGIVVLQKNGQWGGLYRQNTATAFSFKYQYLGHAYGSTYTAQNYSNKLALVKPGDRLLTDFVYIGFSKYNVGSITEFVKSGFWGETRGRINLDTGREL